MRSPNVPTRRLVVPVAVLILAAAVLSATAADAGVRAEREAAKLRAAEVGDAATALVLPGAPRPAPSMSEAGAAAPRRDRESFARGEWTGARSLSTITDEAGMAVPRGGDDVAVTRSAELSGPTWLHIASDGTYFAAVTDADRYQVYRSTDKGESWILWSTFEDPQGLQLWIPACELAEGNVDRLFLAYPALVGSDRVVRVAHADIHAAVPSWTVVDALATPGIDHGHNLRIDMTTDATVYPDFFVYVVAQSDDGNGTDIWFARSATQGSSFEPGYRLATSGVGGYASHAEPVIAYGADNYVHVAYGSRSGDDDETNYRRAASWANGGLPAWEAAQTIVPVAAGSAQPTGMTAAIDNGGVYVTLVTFDDDALPELRFSSDSGATWPPSNQTNSANFPTGTGMGPTILPGGELAVIGTSVSSDGGGFIMDVVESRSTVADPTVWTPQQSYSRHRWVGGTYSLIQSAVPDPDLGNRLAVLWVQTTEPERILRFDAEWRRDPGYPNTDVGFPQAVVGGGYSPPAIVEIDGDPELEIVFATVGGDIHVLDHDGEAVPGWPVNIGSLPFDAPVAVGDLDGDGEPSIVVGNQGGEVWAFAPDGTVRPGWPVTMDQAEDVFVSIGALGGMEPRTVIALCGNEMRAIDSSGQDISPLWGSFTEPLTRPAAIGDVDDDGTAEIVTLKGGWLHIHNLTDSSSEVFRFFGSETFSDAPTLADVDLDGTLEIAAPTTLGLLYLLDHDGSDYSPDWPITVPSGSALTAVAFGQILGTFEPELVFGERENGLIHIRYQDGAEQSGYPKDSGSSVLFMPPMLSPVNISVSNVNVGTTDFSTGTVRSWRNLGFIPDGWPKNMPGPVEETFAAGDIDLDGRNELVVLGVEFLTVLDVGVAPEVDPDNHWPMYGYDPQRTGCLDCEEILTAVEDTPAAVSSATVTAHPNPFNPATVIDYAVPRAGPVTLEVYDLAGRKVATLVGGEHREAGHHRASYAPRSAASSVYLLRLQTVAGEATQKIVLLK